MKILIEFNRTEHNYKFNISQGISVIPFNINTKSGVDTNYL